MHGGRVRAVPGTGLVQLGVGVRGRCDLVKDAVRQLVVHMMVMREDERFDLGGQRGTVTA